MPDHGDMDMNIYKVTQELGKSVANNKHYWVLDHILVQLKIIMTGIKEYLLISSTDINLFV